MSAALEVRVVAACGLLFEAKIAERLGHVIAIAGGGDAVSLDRQLSEKAVHGASGIISFGLAGALEPSLKAGDVVIGTGVIAGSQQYPTHEAWAGRMATCLAQSSKHQAVRAPVYGSIVPISSLLEKSQLRRESGCWIVDMESLVAARIATRLGLPFAVLRVVADDAASAVPNAALVGMRKDGTTDALAVIRALAREPSQTAALFRLAAASQKARTSLLGCVRLLEPGLGGIDLG